MLGAASFSLADAFEFMFLRIFLLNKQITNNNNNNYYGANRPLGLLILNMQQFTKLEKIWLFHNRLLLWNVAFTVLTCELSFLIYVGGNLV